MTKADGNATSIQAPSTEGTYYLYVIDAAGNVAVGTKKLTVDNTAPTSIDADYVFYDDQNVDAGANVDIRASGESEVWFAPENTTVFTQSESMTKAASNATSIKAPSTTGDYYLYLIDAAGNVGRGIIIGCASS